MVAARARRPRAQVLRERRRPRCRDDRPRWLRPRASGVLHEMTDEHPDDVDNPFFVHMYLSGRKAASKRGEDDHSRRTLAGLAGRVVEIGPGDGRNLPHYPAEVTEVIAVEPE